MSNINNFSISEVASQVTDAEIRAVAAIKDLFLNKCLAMLRIYWRIVRERSW